MGLSCRELALYVGDSGFIFRNTKEGEGGKKEGGRVGGREEGREEGGREEGGGVQRFPPKEVQMLKEIMTLNGCYMFNNLIIIHYVHKICL